MYAARLRLDENTSMEKRVERANDVMKMLGLEEVADVLVGSSLVKVRSFFAMYHTPFLSFQKCVTCVLSFVFEQGISGGQARRLTIGVEIVQLPDVVFLDEPTTGLDSQISLEVSYTS